MGQGQGSPFSSPGVGTGMCTGLWHSLAARLGNSGGGAVQQGQDLALQPARFG
jgi:hypothetical protein